jgi:hypothetical protein
MAETVRRTLTVGAPDGLQFELSLAPDPPADVAGLAWGDGLLRVCGEAVWCADDGAGGNVPLRWTWVDLLEFLAMSWPWLLLEETWPVPVKPLFPRDLRAEVERRWQQESLAEADIDREDEEVYRFLLRHDMAMGLKGLFVPSLIIMRMGQQFVLSCPTLQRDVLRPADEVIATLTELGDQLAAVLAEHPAPRALFACDLWQRRRASLLTHVVQLRSGLDAGALEQLAADSAANDASWWELDPEQPDADTELFAAARMSIGHLDITTQCAVLDLIRETPPSRCPVLDGLSARLRAAFDERGPPFAQGYWIANWLRSALGLAPHEPVDPLQLLTDWGVVVGAVDLGDGALEAIAAWGPRHGPTVLHRPVCDQSPGDGRPYPQTRLRATLAHEICHLLVDRQRALPVADVLGGASPEYPEKRARAFAAELLLPRKTAAAAVRDEQSLDKAVATLRARFQVSRDIAGWQVRRSDAFASLSRLEQKRLEEMVQAGAWP